jgi:hypothetical protein
MADLFYWLMAVSDPCLVTKSLHEKSRETKTLLLGQESQNYLKNIIKQFYQKKQPKFLFFLIE